MNRKLLSILVLLFAAALSASVLPGIRAVQAESDWFEGSSESEWFAEEDTDDWYEAAVPAAAAGTAETESVPPIPPLFPANERYTGSETEQPTASEQTVVMLSGKSASAVLLKGASCIVDLNGAVGVKWSSSKKSVATVTALGADIPGDAVVTGVSGGTAKITVSAKADGKSVSRVLNVTVIDPTLPERIHLELNGETLSPGHTEPLLFGGQIVLTGVMEPDTATGDLTWKSSNAKIVTVLNGVVTAGKKAGIAVITVKTRNGKTASMKIKAIDPTVADSVALAWESGIPLADDEIIRLNWGEKAVLTGIISPDTATGKLSWSASGKKIVEVKNGEITALKEGKSVVTVKTGNKKTDKATIVVSDPFKPTGIAIADKSITRVSLDKELVLNAIQSPENAAGEVTWSVSNRKIATVENGTVKPLKEGIVTVSASTRTGKKDSLKITVFDPSKAVSVSLSHEGKPLKNGETIDLAKNQTLTLKADMEPETAADKLTWSSADKTVATVNDGVVTALNKLKKTKVTVKTSNGKSAFVYINVIEQRVPPTAIIGEWAPNAGDNTVEMGDSFEAYLTLRPVNALAEVTWESSDPGVARIAETSVSKSYNYCAVIESVSIGTTRITARTDNGLEASFDLKVTSRVLPEQILYARTGLLPRPAPDEEETAGRPVDPEESLKAKTGQGFWLSYEVLPSESVLREENCATITSSNPDVAAVTGKTDNGLMDCRGSMDFILIITPKAKGSTIITVELKNGVRKSITLEVE